MSQSTLPQSTLSISSVTKMTTNSETDASRNSLQIQKPSLFIHSLSHDNANQSIEVTVVGLSVQPQIHENPIIIGKNKNKRKRYRIRQYTDINLTSFTCEICNRISDLSAKKSYSCDHFVCEQCFNEKIIKDVYSQVASFCFQPKCCCFLAFDSPEILELPFEIQKKYKDIMEYHAKSKIGGTATENGQSKIKELSKSTKEVKFQCNNQQNFTQIIDKYTTCKKCKNIVQKKVTQFQIKCQCQYSFCYLCQQEWQQKHMCEYLCKVMQNRQNVIAVEKNNQSEQTKQNQPTQKNVIKRYLFSLLWLPIAILLIPKILLKSIFFIIAGLLAGATFYTCVYIINQDKAYKKILFIVIYPITMLIGIVTALFNFFSSLLLEEINFLNTVSQCLRKL